MSTEPADPEEGLEAVPGYGLTDEQTMRIASAVMEQIGELGAPKATPHDVARIMGITLGMGRAVAPPSEAANFEAAFEGGQLIAASWAAEIGAKASGQ